MGRLDFSVTDLAALSGTEEDGVLEGGIPSKPATRKLPLRAKDGERGTWGVRRIDVLEDRGRWSGRLPEEWRHGPQQYDSV